MQHRVLVVGGGMHGGDCTGLARGFRALGHAVDLVGTDRYMSTSRRSLAWRALGKVLTPSLEREYNRAIVQSARLLQPSIVVVFKGNHVQPETLERLRDGRTWLVNFYPDNSLLTHKNLNTEIFQFFDHVFTTKRFGVADFAAHLGVTNVSFLPHGYDPQVHRPFRDPGMVAPWACDVSFIGTWSPHKEALLTGLRDRLLPGQLRIWGAQWERRVSRNLDDAIVGVSAVGDQYALAVSGSKINLGLLSERRVGASDDDQTTSRTFHIPGCGGFLLHERTEEVADYFSESREIECFSGADELAAKVKQYLADDAGRVRIARAGHERCASRDSLAHRAQAIIDQHDAAAAQAR